MAQRQVILPASLPSSSFSCTFITGLQCTKSATGLFVAFRSARMSVGIGVEENGTLQTRNHQNAEHATLGWPTYVGTRSRLRCRSSTVIGTDSASVRPTRFRDSASARLSALSISAVSGRECERLTIRFAADHSRSVLNG